MEAANSQNDEPGQTCSNPYAVNYRIVQVHPTLRCNLSCHHCYSSSLPAHSTRLSLPHLKKFLAGARDDGFNVVSLSGGEPFMYEDLGELLLYTRSLGYLNAVASNGMLVTGSKAKSILKYVDLVAISVDGQPAFHDKIRNLDGAFDKMLKGLQVVKDEVGKYGFIHTITDQSLQSILWLTEFAGFHKAQLLQLHPLEMVGRAQVQLCNQAPDQLFLQKLYILAFFLKQKYENEFYVQLDLLHKDIVLAHPQLIYKDLRLSFGSDKPLSSYFKEICIDEKGNILPIGYGINTKYALGNIYDFSSWKNFMSLFHKQKIEKVEKLFNQVYGQIEEDNDLEIIKWNEMLFNQSHFSAELQEH